MGAEGWKPRLLRNDEGKQRDVTSQHRGLRELRESVGVTSVVDMHPWLCDGSGVVLIPTGRDESQSPVLHDLDANESIATHLPGWSLDVQASPTSSRVLVQRIGGFQVLDRGRPGLSIEWRHPENEWPAAFGWLPSGDAWFVVGRVSKKGPSWIWFLTPDGDLLAKDRLEPDEVDPWDRGAYQPVRKGGYSLRFSAGTHGVPSLLDHWGNCRRRQSTGELLLSVARPTGPISHGGNLSDVYCEAEVRWFSVAFSE